MKLYPHEFIQWKPDGSYEIFTVHVDERLPLSPGREKTYPGRPWYRHCYACGLDEGGSHAPYCWWVEWMNLAKKTIL